MKQILLKILLLFVLIGSDNTHAKNTIFLKIGPTFSTFTEVENSKYKVGYSIGLEKSWNVLYNFRINGGVHFCSRGGIICNTTFGHGHESDPVNRLDMHASLQYFSIPLYLNYTIHIKKGTFINLFSGPSIEIAIRNSMKAKNLVQIYDPFVDSIDQFERPDFYTNEDFVYNHGKAMNFGIGIEFSKYKIDYIYSNGLFVEVAGRTDIEKYLRSHTIEFGIKL